MKRRTLMLQTAALSGLSLTGLPNAWGHGHAAVPRILVVLLRGGMDGLTAVPPTGDSEYARIRPNIGIHQPLRLTADFGLHPQLPGMHQLWRSGQLAVVHSTGFEYTGRSHFEGQDIMQTGVHKPYVSHSGWIGRAMEQARIDSGVAISIPMPLVLRGNQRSTTQFPNWMPVLRPQDTQAVDQLWSNDPMLQGFSAPIRDANDDLRSRAMGRAQFQDARSMRGLARVAATAMRRDNGPRVGLVDMTHGFDTHANQGAAQGSHADRLRDLDDLVATFREEMGSAWADTLVVTVTEFGRTVAENGTHGTDHGVGTCCFLAGGLVTESRIYSDWRGLEKKHLFESRDLPATIDIHAVYAKVLERVFSLSPRQITQQGILDFKTSPALAGLLGLG